MKKRILGLLLVNMLLIMSFADVYAQNDKVIVGKVSNVEDLIEIVQDKNGNFSMADDTNSNEVIKLRKVNEEIYEKVQGANTTYSNDKFNKFIKTSAGTFQKAQEIVVDLKNLQEVETLLSDYDFSKEFVDRIHKESNRAISDTRKISSIIKIYTSKSSNKTDKSTSRTTTLSSSYDYTGYNGLKYRDDVVLWDRVSTGPSVVEKGTGTLNVIMNMSTELASFSLGNRSEMYSAVSGILSVLTPAIPSPITTSYTNYFALTIDYQIYTKYTSIYQYVSGVGYTYVNAAVTEKAFIPYIYHDFYYKNNHHTTTVIPKNYVYAGNYSTADVLAYRNRNSFFPGMDVLNFFFITGKNGVEYQIQPK